MTGAFVGFGGCGGKLPPPLPRSVVPVPVDTGAGPMRDGDAAIEEGKDGTVGTEGGVTMMDQDRSPVCSFALLSSSLVLRCRLCCGCVVHIQLYSVAYSSRICMSPFSRYCATSTVRIHVFVPMHYAYYRSSVNRQTIPILR